MLKWLIPVLALAVAVGLILFVEPSDISQDQGAQSPVAVVVPTSAEPTQPLERFLEDASLAVVLRFPETITALGISSLIGIRDDTLCPVSSAYELETMALLDSLLANLGRYDLTSVEPSTALSARIYGWYLEDLLASLRYSDHDYLISSHITSYPDAIERFLTASHPLRTPANASDYISRLGQIALRFDEVIVRLAVSESIGATPPAFILQEAAQALQKTAELQPGETSYYTSFVDRLASAPSISESNKRALETEVAHVIQSSVLPGYQRLATYVAAQAARADDAIGVWRHEAGADYYAHRLRKYTTTDLSAEEIHALGLEEVSRIRSEILDVTEDLVLEAQDGLKSLFEELTQRTGTVTGQQSVDACQELIDGIAERVRPAFHSWPDTDIVVVEGGTSAFFSPGALDGSRPGMFYAPVAREEPLFSLPTLTYHEAIPGHGLQTAYAYAADIPIYRAGLGFTAYAEGWALYSERLAWEMGAYANNAYGNLGRLQAELFRAARLVVDTGIHAKQWSYDRAVAYLQDNTGLDEAFVRQEVERYIVDPGQATAYKIGMLEMMRLRDHAQGVLEDAFDLADFHQAVLEEGDVPLPILEELVETYISNMH
ncbi:DUF885 domain-containing protein [Candidatus Bipolaricaulota bacterium]|nr:DUF885 domain-containing protein [Candidatus Bipolaricaulota bacterium]